MQKKGIFILIFFLMISMIKAEKEKTFYIQYFIPGIYHLEQKQTFKGYFFLSTEIIALSSMLISLNLRNYYYDKYISLTTSEYKNIKDIPLAEKEKFDKMYDKHTKSCIVIQFSIITAMGVFIYNFIDVNIKIFNLKKSHVELKLDPINNLYKIAWIPIRF